MSNEDEWYAKQYLLIMRLVVFVPLVSRVDAVKVPRLARPVFVFPVVARRMHNILFQVENFFLLIQVFFSLSPI